MKKIILPEMDAERVANQIGDFIVNEITSIGYTGGVMGLSGGVDSTVVAALAKKAFDKYNLNNDGNLELNGYLLPSRVNSPKDTEDGKFVAEKLGILYEVLEIEPLVEAFRKTNPETFESKFDVGNLYSEMRAGVLHRKAGFQKKLVIGTGNRGEDFGVGYYTLFGDGAVHMSPIAGLSKRLVRQMATYLEFEKLANRIPTAGLEPGQTDFKDLGYTYDFVELIDEGKRQGFKLEELVNHNQVVEMFNVEKNEYVNLYGKPKFGDVAYALADMNHRGQIAKGKARIVAPPVAKVELIYGGKNGRSTI